MLRPLLADGGGGRAVAALPHVVQDGVSLEIVDEARYVARGVLLDDAAVVQIDLDLERGRVRMKRGIRPGSNLFRVILGLAGGQAISLRVECH